MPGSRPSARDLADDRDAGDRTSRVLARLDRARAELDGQTSPQPAYAARGRTRLLAMAAVRDPAADAARTREAARRRQRAGAWRLGLRTATGMALVVLVTVVAQAAGSALPGSPLYDLKRARERVQVAVERDPLDKGLRHLHQAETRLDEVRALSTGTSLSLGALAPARPGPSRSGPSTSGAASPGPVVVAAAFAEPPSAAASTGSARRVSATLAAMDASTRRGSRLVERVARDGGTDVPLEVLQAWSGQQVTLLSQVVPVVPGASRARAEQSLALLRDVGASAAAAAD